MATGSDEDAEEYLDDPISLLGFEDIKIETCDTDTDDIIDLEDSTDEEGACTSSYGKGNFVLPVTFFDVSRNVRLLNKCKPLRIKIVDCKQHPSYYSKYIHEKSSKQSKYCTVEVAVKKDSNCENKVNNNNMEDTGNQAIEIKETLKEQNADKAQDKMKNQCRTPMTRPDSYYEKLKKRKEQKKQIALKCKDLSRIDLKRNKGLVGLKIKGSIFKKIVDSEMALSKTKSISGENKSKGRCGSDRGKSFNIMDHNLANSKFKTTTKTNSCLNDKCEKRNKNDKKNTSIGKNSDFADDKCKENSEININTASIVIKCNLSNDKSGEGTRIDTEKLDNGTKTDVVHNHTSKTSIDTNMNFTDTKCKDKTKNETKQGRTHIVMKSNLSEDELKKKGEINTKKTMNVTKNNMCKDKSKENAIFKTQKPFYEMKSYFAKDGNTDNKEECETDTEKICIATKKKSSIGNISNGKIDSNTNQPLLITDSAVLKCDENGKSNLFTEKIGATLDNIGTSIILIEDANTDKNVRENDNINNNNERTGIEVATRLVCDKDKSEHNNETNQMRCSLKIACKKIIQKAWELKQAKFNEALPDISNTDVRQNRKEIMNNGDQTVQKFNLKRNHHDVESFCVVSSTDKKQHKKKKRTSKSKRVEKPIVEDENVDQAGSNSPIIPCTTITVRTAQPKLSLDTPVASKTYKQNSATLSNALPIRNQTKQETNKETSKNLQTKPLTIQPPNILLNNEKATNHGSVTTSKNSVTRSNIPTNVAKSSIVSDKNSNSTLKVAERRYSPIFVRMGDLNNKQQSENRLDQKTNPINAASPIITITKSASTGNASPPRAPRNHTTYGEIKNQSNPNPQVPSFIRPIHPSCSGHNAIILRKTPPVRHLQNNAPLNRGQPIPTVFNSRVQNQTFPIGVRPTRFEALPRFQPPNTNVASSFSPARPNQNFSLRKRMPYSSYLRGLEMGLSLWESPFPEHSYPTDRRYPPTPPPPSPSKSVLPPTSVPPQTSASTPTSMMPPAPMWPPTPIPHQTKLQFQQNSSPPKSVLPPTSVPPPISALPATSASTPTSAMPPAPMPPLTQIPEPSKVQFPQNSFKNKLAPANSVIGSTANGELIKKINIVAMPANIANDKDTMLAELNNAIMSPELTINEPSDKSKEISLLNQENDSKTQANSTYTKPCPLSKKINELHNLNGVPEKPAPRFGYSPPILPILTYEEILLQHDNYIKTMNIMKRKIPHIECGKANKISVTDYRKRVSKDDVDGIDLSKIRKAKNVVADEYNHDQGYDSDSTVKI